MMKSDLGLVRVQILWRKKKQKLWGPPAESAERPRSNHQKRVRLSLVNLPLP